jgi:transposase
MSSIKELIVKKFRKNQTRDSIFRELQRFNVTRDFVYQTMKRYKEKGWVEKRKYSTRKRPVSTPPVFKTKRERIRRKCDRFA